MYSGFLYQHTQMPSIQSFLNKSHCSLPVRRSNRKRKAICTAQRWWDSLHCSVQLFLSETETGLWLRPNWSSGICEKRSWYCQWRTGRRPISNSRSKLIWLATTVKKNPIQDFWELQTTSTEMDQSVDRRMEMELVGSLSICYFTKTAKAENKHLQDRLQICFPVACSTASISTLWVSLGARCLCLDEAEEALQLPSCNI